MKDTGGEEKRGEMEKGGGEVSEEIVPIPI